MENNDSTIFEGLNPEQKSAVSCVEGPVLIVAGAGSGKTRVLTSRIAHILETGCPPEQVLALTFTKKAASEMKERIALMVGEKKARKLWMGTFHSVFIRFLREYAESISYKRDFTIYDTSDSISAIKTCLKKLQLDDKVYKPKGVLSRISMAKNNLVTAEGYKRNAQAIQNDAAAKQPRICDIYALYSNKCKQSGVMDFDDILLNMNILLRDNPKALEEIASRFKYIMVDEYQDTNFSQYLILKKLSSIHHNICVVGDDSQSIYAFRGAKIENILNFRKDYPDYKIFRLEQNYRSTKIIVDAANSLIAKNSARIPKNCFSAGDEGERIRLINAYTAEEEALLISLDIISRIHSDAAQYKDFAILYRTNSQSRALEEALRRKNLPYMVYSGNSFFDRAEVKDLMAYFKLIVNNDDDESFKRVVNKPTRGIGDTSVAALTAAAIDTGKSLFDAAFNAPLTEYGLRPAAIAKIQGFCTMIHNFSDKVTKTDAGDIAVSIAVESGILGMYKADNSIEGQSKANNVEELINSVKTFVDERQHEYAEEMAADSWEEDFEIAASDLPPVTLGEFLENVSLLSAVDVEDDEDSDNKIALMTVHSSKGLEFPYVYVSGMEENLFPSGGFLASESDIEEERRLFYVAMTRAKKCLRLTFASTRMRNGRTESNSPSRFIHEINRKYLFNPLPSAEDFATEGLEDDNTSRSGRFSGGFGQRNFSPYGASGAPRTSGSSRASGQFGASTSGTQKSHYPATAEKHRPASNPRPTSSATVRPLPHVTRPPVPDKDFQASPIMELRSGQRIEHNRFGYGVIKEITGPVTDRKAKIAFDEHGEKVLLLKYAKIRIVTIDNI